MNSKSPPSREAQADRQINDHQPSEQGHYLEFTVEVKPKCKAFSNRVSIGKDLDQVNITQANQSQIQDNFVFNSDQINSLVMRNPINLQLDFNKSTLYNTNTNTNVNCYNNQSAGKPILNSNQKEVVSASTNTSSKYVGYHHQGSQSSNVKDSFRQSGTDSQREKGKILYKSPKKQQYNTQVVTTQRSHTNHDDSRESIYKHKMTVIIQQNKQKIELQQKQHFEQQQQMMAQQQHMNQLKKDRNQMLVYYLKNASKIFNEHKKVDQNSNSNRQQQQQMFNNKQIAINSNNNNNKIIHQNPNNHHHNQSIVQQLPAFSLNNSKENIIEDRQQSRSGYQHQSLAAQQKARRLVGSRESTTTNNQQQQLLKDQISTQSSYKNRTRYFRQNLLSNGAVGLNYTQFPSQYTTQNSSKQSKSQLLTPDKQQNQKFIQDFNFDNRKLLIENIKRMFDLSQKQRELSAKSSDLALNGYKTKVNSNNANGVNGTYCQDPRYSTVLNSSQGHTLQTIYNGRGEITGTAVGHRAQSVNNWQSSGQSVSIRGNHHHSQHNHNQQHQKYNSHANSQLNANYHRVMSSENSQERKTIFQNVQQNNSNNLTQNNILTSITTTIDNRASNRGDKSNQENVYGINDSFRSKNKIQDDLSSQFSGDTRDPSKLHARVISDVAKILQKDNTIIFNNIIQKQQNHQQGKLSQPQRHRIIRKMQQKTNNLKHAILGASNAAKDLGFPGNFNSHFNRIQKGVLQHSSFHMEERSIEEQVLEVPHTVGFRSIKRPLQGNKKLFPDVLQPINLNKLTDKYFYQANIGDDSSLNCQLQVVKVK